MGEDMRRVLALIKANTDSGLSAKAIQEALEEDGVHRSMNTIYSLIKQINLFYYPILGEDLIIPVRRHGFIINKDFFEDGQLQFLLDALSYNKDLSYKEKTELKEKLLNFSSTPQKERLLKYETPEDEKTFSLMTNLSVIMKTIATKKNIAFEYVDYEIRDNHPYEVASDRGSRGSIYEVSPYRVILDNNHYYLVCYFKKHKGQLTNFRIDRMRKVRSERGMYVDITDQYSVDSYLRKTFNMFVGGESEVTLVFNFSKEILREVVSRFGMNVSIKQFNKQWYEGRVEEVTYTRGLINWILSMGSLMRIKSPISVREDVLKEVSDIRKNYEEML